MHQNDGRVMSVAVVIMLKPDGQFLIKKHLFMHVVNVSLSEKD